MSALKDILNMGFKPVENVKTDNTPLNKRRRLEVYFIGFLLVTAFFAPLIANEKPLYLHYKNNHLFPALWDINPFASKNSYELKTENGRVEILQADITEWKKLKYDQVLWCPVVYSPGKSDYSNANFVSPFAKQKFLQSQEMPLRFRHFLGTGFRGEDLLAGLIHGCRISLFIGISSMLLAALIGLLLGSLAGYYGDYQLTCSRIVALALLLGVGLGYFYGFYLHRFQLQEAMANSSIAVLLQLTINLAYFLLCVFTLYKLAKVLEKRGWGAGKIFLPIDGLISRSIEIISALPIFILILSLAAISKASLANLILLIAFTSWAQIARLTRAEILRIKKLDYIQAAKALGYSEMRILFLHALQNGSTPALVAISFGVASSILIESSMSFLGIGLPIETVTWGSLLNEGRLNFSAWWMIVFPGIALFSTISCFNLLGEKIGKKM
jgi:peptide/nickel transport system permease protein